uniref:C2H2-type domain-containing protein n=1 Tax=Podarcis muralis TaxID=64176 RepID=A0A670JNW3_PODMU
SVASRTGTQGASSTTSRLTRQATSAARFVGSTSRMSGLGGDHRGLPCVPELRQPDPAGAGGPPVGCEAPKEESLDGRAAVQQKGEDLPNTSSSPLPSPVVEEKSGQEALAAGQSEERDVCGEACEGLAGLEAHRALHFDQETGKVEGEENGGPSAEEEGSPLERPFQCDVCERSYKHAGSLINHKQTHKTGLFHCGVCQKQFFNLMALKNHNRTHFETKRYRCPECPKAFRLQKQLASHQRVHRDRKRDLSSSHSPRRKLGGWGKISMECCIEHSNDASFVSLGNAPLQQPVPS